MPLSPSLCTRQMCLHLQICIPTICSFFDADLPQILGAFSLSLSYFFFRVQLHAYTLVHKDMQTCTLNQARQQLLELQSVREELEARSEQLAGLKKAYELNKVQGWAIAYFVS